jgi:gephyrin
MVLLLIDRRSHGLRQANIYDRADTLESTLRNALTRVDLLITTGGVSMGELDLLKPTIERALGGTIHFGRVSMKPGKPTTFATIPGENIKDPASGSRGAATANGKKVVFSLPGNPASAVVTFMLFVLPALHTMSGIQPVGLPVVKVRLESAMKCDDKREEYARVVVTAKSGTSGEESGLWAVTTGGQRSSRIGSFKGANALVRLPTGGGMLEKGAWVDALVMGQAGGVADMM